MPDDLPNRSLVYFLFGVAAGALLAQAFRQRRATVLPQSTSPDGRGSDPPVGPGVGGRSLVPQATFPETLGFIGEVVIPILAKGIIIRRPVIVRIAEQLNLDQRAVRRVRKLRDKYGPGPLLLRVPLRRQALILNPAHVQRVLHGSPEPFATASFEK